MNLWLSKTKNAPMTEEGIGHRRDNLSNRDDFLQIIKRNERF